MQFPVLRIGKKETKLKQTFGVCSCSWLLLAVGILLLTFRKNLISLQLVSSHTQSQEGNGLRCLASPGPLIGQRPQPRPLIGWWWPVVRAPGPTLSRTRNSSASWTLGALRSCRTVQITDSLYYEHKWRSSASLSLSEPQLSDTRLTMRLIVWLFWQFSPHY